jgi:hypothetical protein
MRDHFHTGFVPFVFAGLSAIVMLHILRAMAVQMAGTDKLNGAGKALAAFALAD